MAVIGINYCEFEKELQYKSVYLHLMNKEIIFDSGDFIKDWYKAKKEFLNHIDDEVFLSQSSSVNHFIMDGAPYESAYLIYNDPPILSYEYNENGWEMFVKDGERPTWEELKTYCNS